MFFESDGVNVIQFGTGDIDIAPGLLDSGEIIGSISLIPISPRPIGQPHNYGDNIRDTKIGVHTRLVFTDARSINVFIEQLEEVMRLMTNGKTR